MLICLIDNFIKRRENRQKHYVKKQLNDYANKLLFIALDIICDNYRQTKKYTYDEVEEYIKMMEEVKSLMELLE